MDRRNLLAAWDRVRGNRRARPSGINGLTVAEVRDPGAWLRSLADALMRGTYHPSAARWVDVPKRPRAAGRRRLGILTVRDRVVQAALKQVLEPVLEPWFLGGSFGFRPGRSVPAALDQALRWLGGNGRGGSATYRFAVHLDVADCFDSIDHAILRQRLTEHVADGAVLALLDQILAAGGCRRGRLWWRRNVGI